MLSARYAGHRSIRIEERHADPPSAGEVQIAVAYTGLCGTDLHILHGHMDARISPPQVIGHEMSGTIAAIGDQVEGWSVGDPVTVMPLSWDGTCPACEAGNAHVCHNLALVRHRQPGLASGTLERPGPHGGRFAEGHAAPACRLGRADGGRRARRAPRRCAAWRQGRGHRRGTDRGTDCVRGPRDGSGAHGDRDRRTAARNRQRAWHSNAEPHRHRSGGGGQRVD